MIRHALVFVLALFPALPVTAQEPGVRYDAPASGGGVTINLGPAIIRVPEAPAPVVTAPLRSGAVPIRRIDIPGSTAAERLGETVKRTAPAAPGVVEGLSTGSLSVGCFPAEACDDLYRR